MLLVPHDGGHGGGPGQASQVQQLPRVHIRDVVVFSLGIIV